jgi:hypothetical protein
MTALGRRPDASQELSLIHVVDNGKAGTEHALAFVHARSEHEAEALRRFEAVLRVDPFRSGAGIILRAADLAVRASERRSVAELFAGERPWRIEAFAPDTLTDEELMAVLAFVAFWPGQQNLSPGLVAGVRDEAERRGFARDAVDAVPAASAPSPLA